MVSQQGGGLNFSLRQFRLHRRLRERLSAPSDRKPPFRREVAILEIGRRLHQSKSLRPNVEVHLRTEACRGTSGGTTGSASWAWEGRPSAADTNLCLRRLGRGTSYNCRPTSQKQAANYNARISQPSGKQCMPNCHLGWAWPERSE